MRAPDHQNPARRCVVSRAAAAAAMTNENGNATLADEETALSSAAAVVAAEWAKVATQHRRDAPKATRRTRSTRPACLSFMPGLLLPDELQTMILEAAVVKPAEKEGERLRIDLKPWAMLALANAQWADHIRDLLIPQLWRMRKAKLYGSLWGEFDSLVTALTLRLPPAAYVNWLVALSEQKLQDTEAEGEENGDEEDRTRLQWLLEEYLVEHSASSLLRVAAWTPELLAKATDLLVTPCFDDLDSAGYSAYDVFEVVNGVAQKTHPAISSLAIGSVAAKAPDLQTKASFLLNIYGTFVEDCDFSVGAPEKLAATLADLTHSGCVAPADIAAVVHQLQENELATVEWEHGPETPFAWSRALLLAWAPAVNFKGWSRRDKKALLPGVRSPRTLAHPLPVPPLPVPLPTACHLLPTAKLPAAQASTSGSKNASTLAGTCRTSTPTSTQKRPPPSPPTSASSLPSARSRTSTRCSLPSSQRRNHGAST